jgi:PTS system ascorbate-specific IIC component
MQSLVALVTSILGQAPVLVALVAFVGFVAQRASWERTIVGSLKAFMGMLIMVQGAGVLVGMLGPMADIMAEGFGFQGIAPLNEPIVALVMTKFAQEMALVTVGAFIVNVIVAWLTPLKYIFLSGHHILFIATVTVALQHVIGVEGPMVLVYGSLISGITMAMMPAFAYSFMHKATKGAGFSMGHLATFGYVLASIVAKFTGGDPEETDAEKIDWTGRLSFFRESLLLMGIGVAIVYVIAGILAGADFVNQYTGGQNFVVWMFTQGFVYAAGVAIILLGVRTFVAEIVPSFRGISERIVPGAIPALDVPAVFPYGPNSLLIGMAGYTVGMVLQGILLIAIGFPVVVIPVLVLAFFMGGGAGVMANGQGGRRGAFIGSLVDGFFQSVTAAMLYIAMESLGFTGTTFSDSDFILTGLFIHWIRNMPLVLALYVVFAAIAIWVELKVNRPYVAAHPFD